MTLEIQTQTNLKSLVRFPSQVTQLKAFETRLENEKMIYFSYLIQCSGYLIYYDPVFEKSKPLCSESLYFQIEKFETWTLLFVFTKNALKVSKQANKRAKEVLNS